MSGATAVRPVPELDRDAATDVGDGRATIVEQVRHALYDNGPYVLLVGVYAISAAFILPAIGREIPYSLRGLYPTPVILTGLYVALTLLLAIVVDVFAARRRPFDALTWRNLGERWLGTRRIVGTVIVLVTLPILLNVLAGYRLALTDVKPFTYDELFMTWDRWLHFGRHPWEWLQPVIGHPAVSVFIDRGYLYGWILMMWGCTIWMAVHGPEPLRLQYFFAFAASWVLLGTIAAIAFSSAGPVYYGRVTGLPDPYVPLIEYLGAVNTQTPLGAVDDHERLWLTYRTWGGITAMPSMHMAITTVVVLTVIRAARWLAVVAVPMWVLMMVGSIHLGWHYAIDGYAAGLAAAAIWLGSGRFARWWLERRPEVEPAAHAG